MDSALSKTKADTRYTARTCEARVSDLEVASEVLGAWIMNEQIANIETAGALTGTDAIDLRQHVT